MWVGVRGQAEEGGRRRTKAAAGWGACGWGQESRGEQARACFRASLSLRKTAEVLTFAETAVQEVNRIPCKHHL